MELQSLTTLPNGGSVCSGSDVSCAVYLTAFSFTDYAHPDAEYTKEAKTMLASIEEYEKSAPQINLETAKYSADNIAEGQELFKTNCVTCHGDGGKGGIGPNLTDTHWINIKEKVYLKMYSGCLKTVLPTILP
jgi:cytochrome c oxidase cbb3-type subunit 3